MNVMSSINDLQVKLSNREVLLSDGILLIMNLLRTKLPDKINIWLNRELTGLDVSELSSFTHLNFNYFKVRYIGGAQWCEQPVQGVFVEKANSCDGIFLSLGVQSLEAELLQFLHLEQYACPEASFPPALEHHFIMIEVIDRPGFYFRCHVRDLLRVYSGLRSV